MEGLVEVTSEAPILLVEAFNGGSHKQLISSLEQLLLEKGMNHAKTTQIQ